MQNTIMVVTYNYLEKSNDKVLEFFELFFFLFSLIYLFYFINEIFYFIENPFL